MASANFPIEWTVAGVLDEIGKLHSTMPDRALAFVLGSGASFTSGIPTGKTMAENWLKELHLRECRDGTERDQWLASGTLGIDGLAWEKAAEFYPQIFERRFRGDPESGFASLEAVMEGKEPSLGYSLLAEIMQHTRHKVVVTTNFDNLVADALAIHAHKPPLIVGHESLTGYVRPLSGRPLVAKIHRDLFLHPKNDEAGVSTLELGWQEALTRLFKHYMPLVIGYGGNDGSLMGFLNNLKPGDINGRIFWCYRADSPPSQAVRDLLVKLNGVMVAIPGFDEFMLQLAEKLIKDFDMSAISERIESRGKKRAESYRDQAEKLQKSLASTAKPSKGQVATRRILADAFKNSKNWWAWEMRAQAEADPEKRDHIYRAGIEALPGSAELAGNYANFLSGIRKDYDAAESLYKKALELDPNHANNTGNYALFLSDIRKDYDAAESLYKRVLELDPNHAGHIGNYAIFLSDIRKDYDAAETLYKKALELDPNHAGRTGNYALFLSDIRKDYDAAESLYKRVLELDPNDAGHTGNYAIFLKAIRKDYDAAETLYKKALELDPNDVGYIGNYAAFLSNIRKDYDAAEAMYRKALELDPNHANNNANLAALQLMLGRLDAAKKSAQQAVELSGNTAGQAAAEALLYLALCDTLEGKAADRELGRLKSLLQAGYERGSWSFDALFVATLPGLPADARALYEALGAAILDEQALSILEQNKQWQQIEVRPWPSKVD